MVSWAGPETPSPHKSQRPKQLSPTTVSALRSSIDKYRTRVLLLVPVTEHRHNGSSSIRRTAWERADDGRYQVSSPVPHRGLLAARSGRAGRGLRPARHRRPPRRRLPRHEPGRYVHLNFPFAYALLP
jgi:hypothetical protein